MAFDKPTRNALSKMVAECRRLLTDDVREQLQATYGIQPDGTALAVDKLTHLDDRGLEIATALREWLDHLFASETGTEEQRRKNAFFRMAHETAFTYLNRLAALRMCEERGLVIECVRRGMESDGFALYERLTGQALGDRGQTYRFFLECLFDELAVDLGVLFDRQVPHSLIFPSPVCIAAVLQWLNDKNLAHLWQEDETIGWLYQYFNSRDEIDRMRKKELGGSPSPRNSRELAVRNQFFTPRYVVEFLTDNTLGRIWYEMQQGETVLKNECRYLVRRPHEIFLGPNEQPPETESTTADLSQEERLQRLVDVEDKGDQLDESIQSLPLGQTNCVMYGVNPISFSKVPGSPFAYWASDRLRHLFAKLPAFEGEGRTAKRGPSTCDDFRYVRCWWEVDRTQPHGLGEWRAFAKGGIFSPFYADIHLVVDWEPRRSTFLGFFGRPGREIERPESVNFFFRPGLTWPRRTQSGLALRVLPTGCIFADKGPAAFVEGDDPDDLLALLAITNSLAFRQMVNLQMAFGSYEVGVIQRTPVPPLVPETTQCLATLARRAWSLKYSIDTASETSHAFVLPALLQTLGESLIARAWTEKVRESNARLADIQAQIDEYVFNLYGISEPDREHMRETLDNTDDVGTEIDGDAEDNEETTQVDAPELVAQLISYGTGVAFNRFDLDLAIGKRSLPPEPEPFAPLPVCSPGMLAQANGLPAEPTDVSSDYPLRISWSGLLVDDEGNPDDIIGRIRQMIEIVYLDRAADIEHEACNLLGVKSLQDYITRPNGFFADHLKLYSKSRRKAPIYWPLSTVSGSYTVWLYYHRLTDQTLYTIVNHYVAPKIEDIQRVIVRIEANLATASGADATRLRDALHEHRKFLGELQDMKQELLRIAALPYKPDLNDGVIINAAPLYTLFQHRTWAKDCADCWKKLENRDYDWSHMAYTIWPERVREKCKKDRSLAIAHGLEDLCAVPLPGEKKTRKRSKSTLG